MTELKWKIWLKNPLFWALVFSWLYWVYLLFSTAMIIRYDSLDYEHLGRILVNQDWREYFTSGPNREPFYPLVVALAMKMAVSLGVSYQKILTAIQLLILGLTQILIWSILRKLNIGKILTALIIAYVGFSPALVNSTLSLYSEIVTYPLVLGIILMAVRAWDSLWHTQTSLKQTVIYAFWVSIFFVFLLLTKNIFEIIFPVFLVPFIGLTIYGALNRRDIVKNCAVFVFISVAVFYLSILGYKSLNKMYNGNFAITERGAWALYGNTSRRMDPLTSRRLLTALTYAPGEGVCHRFYSQKECAFWSFEESDQRGFTKLGEYAAQNMTQKEINKQLLKESFTVILQNPFQYIFFMGIEGIKMFFWESTQIGWVDYPKWLSGLFNAGLFKDGIRLGIFLLTFGAFVFCCTWLIKNYKNHDVRSGNEYKYLSFSLYLLILYIGAHTFFFTLTRYSLPVAAVFLTLIGFSMQKLLGRK